MDSQSIMQLVSVLALTCLVGFAMMLTGVGFFFLCGQAFRGLRWLQRKAVRVQMDPETDEQYLRRTHVVKDTANGHFMFKEKTSGLWATTLMFDEDIPLMTKCIRTMCLGVKCQTCMFSCCQARDDSGALRLDMGKLGIKPWMSLKEKFNRLYWEKPC